MKRRTFLERALGITAIICSTPDTGLTEVPRAPIPGSALAALKPDEPVHFPKSRALVIVDRGNNVTAFDERCTHKGCVLSVDFAARAFPCPCHGSKFDFTGKVIQGPALTPLVRLKVERTRDGGVELK
ncbi:MAG: Rieske (2Fe-2S) protein [Pseudomonadota bacterium]